MSQTKLSPEDKKQIINALNRDLEPSPELLAKLFPSTAEKFDVVRLDRAKIPTLEYNGKRTKAAILAEGTAGIGAAPLQTVRCFGKAEETEWRNLIVQGDNLQFLKTCYKNTDLLIKDKVKGKVKLIYIDPPFATKSDFGGKDGEYSYADKVDRAHFLETLRERFIFLQELLTDDGSIYIHLDQRMSHYVKIILDEIFGKDCFVNHIVWKRTFSHGDSGQGAKHFGRLHDAIFLYKKSLNFTLNNVYTPYSEKYKKNFYKYNDEKGTYRLVTMAGPGGASKGNPFYEVMGVKRYWMYSKKNMAKLIANGEVVQTNPGNVPQRKRYLESSPGVPLQDLWTDIAPIQGSSLEKMNYPTQKPEQLLERLMLASSNEGDLVMDCFAGSGTTGAVAEKLGRRWIMCDFGKHAIYTMQKRMLRIDESKDLLAPKKEKKSYKKCEECGGKVLCSTEFKYSDKKYNKSPKSFCVVSSGAYDFTHVMDLRKNKDTYIDFVLGLFQLIRDEEKASKFRLSNIYSLKDSNPVEVYPVWDDKYLKEIRIDERYLQSIVDQAGGRLKGDYFIITPESCANVGDTSIKNQDGKDVNFHILSFPYKILEDISQKLELQEQPSSAKNINDLVTSTSFYFNEDVVFEAERVEKGLKITKFETKILDRAGNKFEDLAGIAMVLVDLDYEPGKPFDMDVAIYAKEVNEEGFCKLDKLTKSVGVIAIDKHGNESKPHSVK